MDKPKVKAPKPDKSKLLIVKSGEELLKTFNFCSANLYIEY